MHKRYLLVSDFDQTLSFNDSGHLLSEMLGIARFDERVAGLSRLNLVQEGAELAYLLRHDPEFRRVRRDDLVAVGRTIRLKRNIARLAELLATGIDDAAFDFYVVSAAPEEIVLAALDGLEPASHVVGTRLGYDANTGEIAAYTSAEIRSLFERHGLVIQEWDRVRTDWLTIGATIDTAEMPVIEVAA